MVDTNNLMAGLSADPVLVSQARSGDPTASKELLRKASESIASGKELSLELREWLAGGLNQLANSDNPKTTVLDAFNLRKPKGKPSQFGEELERLVAEAVLESPRGRHKGVNQSGELGAYEEVAEMLLDDCNIKITANTVEKFYQKHVQSIQDDRLINQEIESDT